ncbi:DUF2269 domain-containing protein [Frankia tisae]|uniref:DUF2269 domain-containing protein n=1 Tax=Frankia tisae TaxID=2950104 RepID=UPI0021C15C2A|nr:DUF2269 domain-containing protein [Frankia tisae]
MPHPGSFGLLLTLHILLAIFVVGPLTLVCASVPSLLRTGPRALPILRLAGRLVRGFAVASLLIVVTGAGMVHQGSFGSVRSFSDSWLLGSLVLWVVACGICLAVIAPSLSHAIAEIDAGGDARRRLGSITGGAVLSSACWVVVIALMVVKPGA